jgi:hypothetical protein
MPELRDDRLDDAYTLTEEGDGRIAVRRLGRDGTVELGVAWPQRRAPDRLSLASAILEDALAEPPPRKLVRDYSRFVPLPHGGEVRIEAGDLSSWLATWEPPIAALLRRLP